MSTPENQARLASIDENVRVIRRYCSYIAFVIVLTFAFGVLGAIVNILNT